MKGLFFFCGYETLECAAHSRTELLNFCMREGITYRDFCVLENGNIRLTLSLRAAKKAVGAAERCGICIKRIGRGGVPHLAFRYRKRAGVFLGTLIAVLLLTLSERYVWDVRVSGNEVMTADEVIDELAACGFGIGSYIPDVQNEVLENRVLLASDRISWISLYMDGTVARVQVIEHKTPAATKESTRPANLIASADGQIEMLQLYRGNCIVKVGQAVKKGELLVSGLYDSNTGGFRYTRACGQVYARTERVLKVEIPLCYTEKRYQSEKCIEIDLKFFGKTINFFKNTTQNNDKCDIIENNKTLDVFGLFRIPVGWSVTTAIPYDEIECTRTHEEALELAYEELDEQLAQLSECAQLLSKEIQTVITDSSVSLVCTVRCIEDIAVQAEFDVAD